MTQKTRRNPTYKIPESLCPANLQSMMNTNRELRILQMNLHTSKERTHGVLSDPDTKNFMTLLLQEPYWSEYNKESPSHQSWTRYEPTSQGKTPRAVTYINKAHITPAQVTQLELPFTDVVALQIHPVNHHETSTLVVNIYNPGDESIIQDLHEILRRKHIENNATVILAGDFNCHHPMWNPAGYLRHDNTADHLVELAADLGLVLLIPPGTITYPNGQTAIDLVWGNHAAETRLLKCRTADENDQGSDHLPIETWLSSTDNSIKESTKLDFSRTDWEKFNDLLKAELPSVPPAEMLLSPAGIDKCVTQLTNTIQRAIAETTPIKRPCPHSKRWWTRRLTTLRRQSNKMRNKYRRTRQDHDKKAWRKKANEYTKEIANAKTRTWKEYVKNMDYKSIRLLKRYLDGSLHQTAIPTLDGKAETYEQMSNTLQCNFFPPPPPADLKDIRHATYPQEAKYDPIISIQQIRAAVSKTAPNKAPGPDGIPNRVLKQALPCIEIWLQKILQASLNLGYFPKAFKETTTIVLRKPGKPDYSKTKAYRPIALENTIGKVFESVIAEAISYLTETNELLPAHHYGGRPGRSTEDAMMILSESIHKAWREKKVFSAVFLDVAGAFNNVHHKRLLHNLKMRRVPTTLVKWLESFLRARSTKMYFNNRTSDSLNVPAGVPQGSPLSLLLYMYYNVDLLDVATKPNDIALGFIDDIVYGTAGTTDIGNVRKLKQMLKEAEKWRTRHGAQFEQSKYILVHFTRNYRKSTEAALTIEGTKIEPTDEAKYLGVIFDKGLRYKAHQQYAVKKGTAAALALGSIGKANWGAPCTQIRQLFQTTVAARLDYAAII